jgi:hypothetical protein
MDILDYLGFWDFAIIIYMVGYVLAFITIRSRLSKPECYRIPLSLFFAIFWPLIVVAMLCIAIILVVENLLNIIRNFILRGRE